MESENSVSETQALRQAGLQVTAQRLAVYRAVNRFPHALADEICERVRAEIGAVSRQAVYDALNVMTEHGLLRRIQPAGSTARYEKNFDNHHHVVCRRCGKMEDTACAVGHAPCLEALDPRGYRIEEAEVIYWGLCPDCQNQNNS
ncbi:MAG: Fur family transcriptional regulator [Kiritimatiellia bacterium]